LNIIIFTWILVSRIKLWEILLIIALSVLTGFLFYQTFDLNAGIFIAFIQWQVLIGFSLGYFSYKHRENNEEFLQNLKALI